MPGLAARRPAGEATGTMDGWYPNDLAIGTPLVFGVVLMDDFIRPPDGTYYGDLFWSLQDFSSVATASNTAPAANDEAGICRVTTGICSPGEGGAIGYGDGTDRTFYRAPPAGSVYLAKLRAVDITQITIASGFFEIHSGVTGATSNDFIGFRGVGGANWYGVVRNGTAESTVDLGIAVSTSWAYLGFRRETDGTVQFFQYERDGRNFAYRVEIGAPVATTNLPNTTLCIAPLNVITLDGASKSAEIDFVCLGGRTER
jgi:hypothetical protein